jgi:hypothetical protein
VATYHRNRLRAWKPDAALNSPSSTRGRREAVDQRTRLSNAIKSQLKVYFPLSRKQACYAQLGSAIGVWSSTLRIVFAIAMA